MKVKKVLLQAYYDLDGEYLPFPDNPLHGKVFENVDVEFATRVDTIGGLNFEVDVIEIEGQEPIECELVGRKNAPDGTLIIKLCQDWG